MLKRRIFGFIALFGLAAVTEAAPIVLGNLAGRYYYGDGLGVNRTLTIHPDGTFEYAWHGCLGLYASAQGRISVDGEGLVLEPSRQEGEGGPSTRLRVVRWGERIYLLNEDELSGFANAINHEDEPRSDAHGLFYLRDGDWDRPVTGAPPLPARTRELLLPRPLLGKVLRKVSRASFEIDLGARDGLKPGLELYASGKQLEYGFCDLTVVSAAEATAVVQGDEDCRRLRAGMSVCSRFADCPH